MHLQKNEEYFLCKNWQNQLYLIFFLNLFLKCEFVKKILVYARLGLNFGIFTHKKQEIHYYLYAIAKFDRNVFPFLNSLKITYFQTIEKQSYFQKKQKNRILKNFFNAKIKFSVKEKRSPCQVGRGI